MKPLTEIKKERMTYRDWAYFVLGILGGIVLTLLWKVTGVIK